MVMNLGKMAVGGHQGVEQFPTWLLPWQGYSHSFLPPPLLPSRFLSLSSPSPSPFPLCVVCTSAVGLDPKVQATPLSDLPASPLDSTPKTPKKNRCFMCRKKVGLTGMVCVCVGGGVLVW